jgi:small redox-active disulfide protein 2
MIKMKKIKVLGTGCPKCNQTLEVVRSAIERSGSGATVEKVDDIMKILEYDVMSTPAVVVDEEVKIKGRVPSIEEMITLLN